MPWAPLIDSSGRKKNRSLEAYFARNTDDDRHLYQDMSAAQHPREICRPSRVQHDIAKMPRVAPDGACVVLVVAL